MKTFSREEIARTLRYFHSKGFERKKAEVGGRFFTYFVVPQQLNDALPDFAMRMTGESGELYAVSDSVPEAFREFVVAHEVYEFRGEGKSCTDALAWELTQIPDDIKQEYLQRRRTFFQKLGDYAEGQPLNYTAEDVSVFRANAVTLDKLLE